MDKNTRLGHGLDHLGLELVPLLINNWFFLTA